MGNPMNMAQKVGKYLTFVLDQEQYGLEILRVREIIGLMKITVVPQTPNYLKGVINLRGKVIPVIDLRVKFGLPAIEVTKESCIIVVEMNKGGREVSMGIFVDSVSEVVNIEEQDLDETPDFGSQINTDFISGIGKTSGTVKILLDINKVLSDEDLASVQVNPKLNQ